MATPNSTHPSPLYSALQCVNGFAAPIGELFKDLTNRISVLENKVIELGREKPTGQLKIEDRKAIAESLAAQFEERVSGLEDSLDGILESEAITSIAEKHKELENLIYEELDKIGKTQVIVSEPPPEQVKAAKPEKKHIAIFGCLPRQYQRLVQEFPHLDIKLLKTANSRFNKGPVFFCTGLANSGDRKGLQSANPDNIVEMQGGLITWKKAIREYNYDQ